MGLLTRLLRRATSLTQAPTAPTRTPPGAPPSTAAAAEDPARATPAGLRLKTDVAPVPGFAVIDLETTGFSPARERVVEVAVVHVDPAGQPSGQWTTLVHPGRPGVGPIHVHGITPDDVRHAPRFEQIARQLVDLLIGRVLVAHNAAFDLPFLATELARAGIAMPNVPHLCTLQASWDHLPDLPRRRLADCCAATGIRLDGAHAALNDAVATAALLGHYRTLPTAANRDIDTLLSAATTVTWPTSPAATTPATVRVRVPHPRGTHAPHSARPAPATSGRLTALLQSLPLDFPGSPLPAAASYLELLAEVMADGVITDAEVDALTTLATTAGLTRGQVHAAHRGVLVALAQQAVADGRVTHAERADLLAHAAALGLDATEVTAVLGQARAERTNQLGAALAPLPQDWRHGEPLRVGQSVAFTGGEAATRALLECRTREAGVSVSSAVSRKTALLVTDDITSGTAKARAALQHGTRVVDLGTYALLLQHVQPACSPAPRTPESPPELAVEPLTAPRTTEVSPQLAATPAPTSTTPTPPTNDAAVVDLRPSDVRAWAREQGIAVGDRGRLPRSIVDAYAASLANKVSAPDLN